MTEDQRKHLDYIQGVVTRMAGNSFLIRGWALTVGTALYSYAATKDSWTVALIGIGVSLVFAFLDGYYTRQERLFRGLFEAVAKDDAAVPLFCMDVEKGTRERTRIRDVARSLPLLVLFGALVILGIVVALMTAAI